MYRFIRFFNQNKAKIIKVILVIALIIIIIQLMNHMIKVKNEKPKEVSNVENDILEDQALVSDKSSISGNKVQKDKLKSDTDIINDFFKYCNEQDINSAYNMLTDECKEEMFPIIEDFYNIYYSKIFDGETKSFSIENWTGSIYKVNIVGDILATGNVKDSLSFQDYITVKEAKLNINNYVGRKKVNRTTERENIKVTVQSIDTYMNYEKYNLIVENNSENTILLGDIKNPKSIYLLNDKDSKYYFYNNEISTDKLIIQSKYKNSITIKFMNAYNSTYKNKSLVFSNMIMNYDEYKILENKENYKTYKYEVKL